MTEHPALAYRRLRRPTDDRMIGGVAAGLARYFSLDPTLVRVAFVVAAVLTGGAAVLAYPAMWFVMPQEDTVAPPTDAGAPTWPAA